MTSSSYPLTYVIPTRGRPTKITELLDAWRETRTVAQVYFIVDESDPHLAGYRAVLYEESSRNSWVRWVRWPGSGMVNALNYAAMKLVERHDSEVIGFMGDDHRPRTHGWDKLLIDVLNEHGPGLAYGNDLLQGANLPTQVAMSASIIRALGHMAPRELTHLYVDNYWKRLGNATSLTYVPACVIEHMHPVAGKSEWDDGYRAVNSGAMYSQDHTVFEAYEADGRLDADIKLVNNLRRS